MRSLVFLKSARDDLTSIFRYTTRESGSLIVGKAFVVQLREKCSRLAALPGTLGSPRSELKNGIRSTPFRAYVIFFSYGNDTVEIINVLHSSRDIDRFYEDDI